jgi:hypothetical protein
MHVPFLSFLAAGVLAGFASAQSCAALAVSNGTGPNPAVTTVTFALHGDANAPAALAIGATAGSTSIALGPLCTLELGLDRPFALFFIGITDGSGDVSHTIRVPAHLPGMDLNAQGLTVTFTAPPQITLTFCTSNVASFHVGA